MTQGRFHRKGLQLVEELLWNYGVESRGVVNEKNTGICVWRFQMLKDEVDRNGDSIIYRAVLTVGKLKGVQGR